MNRLVFFTKSTEKVNAELKYYYEDKLKESRRQLICLSNLLGLPSDRTCDKIVGEAMLDLRDVKDPREEEINENSSSNESRFSDSHRSKDSDTSAED